MPQNDHILKNWLVLLRFSQMQRIVTVFPLLHIRTNLQRALCCQLVRPSITYRSATKHLWHIRCLLHMAHVLYMYLPCQLNFYENLSSTDVKLCQMVRLVRKYMRWVAFFFLYAPSLSITYAAYFYL